MLFGDGTRVAQGLKELSARSVTMNATTGGSWPQWGACDGRVRPHFGQSVSYGAAIACRNSAVARYRRPLHPLAGARPLQGSIVKKAVG